MKRLTCCLALLVLTIPVHTAGDLLAIDVLILPGERMLKAASEWNGRMREQSPQGFELDETHQPHITLLQRHISAADLDAVLAAVDHVKGQVDIDSLEMTAVGLYHVPSGDIGLAGITIEPTDELLTLQQAVVDAVNPFDQGGGDERAYVPDPSGTPFDPFLFKYVAAFVPEQTGEKFNPHVTIGIAPKAWLERLEKQPFDRFTFGARGLAVYPLGNFGTAAKRLDGE